MSDAKRCDRCKKFYAIFSEDWDERPSYSGRPMFGVGTLGSCYGEKPIKTYDLCIDCANELNEFLNGTKRGEDE